MIIKLKALISSKYTAIFWSVLIFILCTVPSQSLPTGQPSDKVSHLLAFAGFSFFWFFHSMKYWLIILMSIIYGIAIEFWQAILPESFHRGFDWYDALADVAGGIIGYFIYLIYKKIVTKYKL
jgi:VanZ family protein